MSAVGFLHNRTWWTLRVVALMHGLRFDTHQNKEQAQRFLYNTFIEQRGLSRTLKQLSQDEWAALRALQAAGGTLPLWRFIRAFGAIRPYKPWHNRRFFPWKRPQSVSETLWYLGLIEIDSQPRQIDRVVLPPEVLALLPALPRPQMRRTGRCTASVSVESALADFVGLLLAERPKLVYGRWLPPWFLDKLNARLVAPDRSLAGVRSELQTRRIRALHYIAQAAGLVAADAHGRLQPTVSAWTWLSNPQPEILLTAIAADLRKREGSLWSQFRFSEVSANVWDALLDLLKTCEPDRLYSLRSIHRALVPHVPGESLRTLEAVLRQVLMSLGWVTVRGANVAVHAHVPYTPQPALWAEHDGAYHVDLPVKPHLHAAVSVTAWAGLDHRRCWIDAASVRRAVEQGYSADEIIRDLSVVCHHPLTVTSARQIERWHREAHRLTLCPMLVLTAHDRDTLTRIRSDWRLRPLLGEVLSPHHVAVKPSAADTLRQRLDRRGLPVTRLESELTPESDTTTLSEAEYLALAARIYQRLGDLIPLKVRLPSAVIHMLDVRAEALDPLVDEVIDALRGTLSGHQIVAGGIEQSDHHAIRQAVERALDDGTPLRMEYHSPALGQTTIRMVEPLMVYHRNGADYMEAYCLLEHADRTFRLDRILRLLDDD